MGSSKRLKSTLLPIAEHRQAMVCGSCVVGGGEGAASQESSSSGKGRRYLKVVRSLVRLKDAFVELMVSEGGTPAGRNGGSAAFGSMGAVMGPVDFGGFGAVSFVLARNSKCNSTK